VDIPAGTTGKGCDGGFQAGGGVGDPFSVVDGPIVSGVLCVSVSFVGRARKDGTEATGLESTAASPSILAIWPHAAFRWSAAAEVTDPSILIAASCSLIWDKAVTNPPSRLSVPAR
jgi:hypothetical protein